MSCFFSTDRTCEILISFSCFISKSILHLFPLIWSVQVERLAGISVYPIFTSQYCACEVFLPLENSSPVCRISVLCSSALPGERSPCRCRSCSSFETTSTFEIGACSRTLDDLGYLLLQLVPVRSVQSSNLATKIV